MITPPLERVRCTKLSMWYYTRGPAHRDPPVYPLAYLHVSLSERLMEHAAPLGDVLIVEDDQGCIDLITEVVSDLGHGVVVCERAEAALTQIQERPPALVVLDVMLPDGDGFSVLQAIRQNPATTTIPVLLCTAALFEVMEYRKPVDDLYTDIVAKPFHIDTFIAMVNRLLSLP